MKTIKRLGLEKEFKNWLKDIKDNPFRRNQRLELMNMEDMPRRMFKGQMVRVVATDYGDNVLLYSEGRTFRFPKKEMKKHFKVLY